MIYTVHVYIREYSRDNDEYDEIYTFNCINDANDCVSFFTNRVDHPDPDYHTDPECEYREFYPSNLVVCDDLNHVNQLFGRTHMVHDHNSVTFTP